MNDINFYDISVIIPIYNVENYLSTCIDSVLKQRDVNMEIILVNDGSTDKSKEIALKYSSSYKNISLIEQKNLGPSAARNAGIVKAKGKYIYFIDSDDFLVDNVMFDMFNIAENNNADLCFFSLNKYLIDDNGQEHIIPSVAIPNMTFQSGKEAYLFLMNTKNYFTGVVIQLVKKDILLNNDIKFIDGIYHEDHEYTFKILMNAKKTICSNLVIYNYRKRSNSIMTSDIKNGERFVGFSKTYHEMIKETKRHISHNEYVLLNAVKNHLVDICELAAKQYLWMSGDEVSEYSNEIEIFKSDIKNTKLVNLKTLMLIYLKPLILFLHKMKKEMIR